MSGPLAVTKEQKQLDLSIEVLVQKLTDVKNALQAFLFKLENEPPTWPGFMDSFALVSSHLTILNKTLKSEKTSPLRAQGMLPLVLSQDLDAELQRITEGRVPTFNHEVVPHHLRTKPEPEVELKEKQLTHRVMSTSLETSNKQTNSFKRFVESIVDTVSSMAASIDSHISERHSQLPPSHSANDTQALVAALTTGKGLKPLRVPVAGSSAPGGHQGSPMQTSPGPSPHLPSVGSGSQSVNKMSSSVKTNLKSAASHVPYSRN